MSITSGHCRSKSFSLYKYYSHKNENPGGLHKELTNKTQNVGKNKEEMMLVDLIYIWMLFRLKNKAFYINAYLFQENLRNLENL